MYDALCITVWSIRTADARDATKTSFGKQQSMQFTHRLQLVFQKLLIQQKQKLEWLQSNYLIAIKIYDKQIRFQQLVV